MPSLSKNVNIISRCAHSYRSDALCGTSLSACHYFYIFHICNSPGISQDSLAKALYINKSSVARALVTLEDDGYVIRKQDIEDKRKILVYPTDKAKEILPFVRDVARGWNEFLLSCLDENEKTAVLNIIEKITRKAQSYIDENLTVEDVCSKNEAAD